MACGMQMLSRVIQCDRYLDQLPPDLGQLGAPGHMGARPPQLVMGGHPPAPSFSGLSPSAYMGPGPAFGFPGNQGPGLEPQGVAPWATTAGPSQPDQKMDT